jgi:hypothetical protein
LPVAHFNRQGNYTLHKKGLRKERLQKFMLHNIRTFAPSPVVKGLYSIIVPLGEKMP